MLITKSPLRVSYAGGGSDFYDFFNSNSGCVVSTSIDKYVYFFSNPQWELASDRFKFTYRTTESVDSIDKLKHPVVKATLTQMNWRTPLNMATMADMPGRSGLGSSSAFTAGVIQNLGSRNDSVLTKEDLFEKTVNLERVVLREPGGWQDQAATIFGDLRTYRFTSNGMEVSPPLLSAGTKSDLSKCQLLISTNVFRDSHAAAAASISRARSTSNWEQIKAAAAIAEKLSLELQVDNQSVESALIAISEALNEHWEIKKLWQSSQILDLVMDIERIAKKFGILGHKLLGAGDGGYVLVTAEPQNILRLKQYFGDARCSEFKSVENGTTTTGLKD
jgi:D-glycero-alpha-D-manno-heptose-7-phosphate kinase